MDDGLRRSDSLEEALDEVELTPTPKATTVPTSTLDWNDEDLMNLLEEEIDQDDSLSTTGDLFSSRRTMASLDDFEVMGVIGRGASASTKLVRRKDNHSITFAMKVISTGGPEQPLGEAAEVDWSSRVAVLSKQAAAEVTILSKLTHPNVIRYHGSFVRPDACYILMDYADAGDLEHHLQGARRDGRRFTEDEVMAWSVQIILALDYLHSQNILHRDIKLANVFLTSHNVIKLGDFGIAKELETQQLAETSCGTPYYVSPELCRGQSYGTPADVWALGCLMYELMAMERPFDGPNLHAVVWQICEKAPKPLPEGFSAQLSSMVWSMMAKDPAARPIMQELVWRPFVSEHCIRLAQAQAIAGTAEDASLFRSPQEAWKSARLNEASTQVQELNIQLSQTQQEYLGAKGQTRKRLRSKAVQLDDQVKAAHRAWELERALAQSHVLEVGSRGSGLSDEEQDALAEVMSASSSTGTLFLTEEQLAAVWNRFDKSGAGVVERDQLGAIIDECLFLTASSVKHETHRALRHKGGADKGSPKPLAEIGDPEDVQTMQSETKRLLLHLVRANKEGVVSKQEFMQRWNDYGERVFTAKSCTVL